EKPQRVDAPRRKCRVGAEKADHHARADGRGHPLGPLRRSCENPQRKRPRRVYDKNPQWKRHLGAPCDKLCEAVPGERAEKPAYPNPKIMQSQSPHLDAGLATSPKGRNLLRHCPLSPSRTMQGFPAPPGKERAGRKATPTAAGDGVLRIGIMGAHDGHIGGMLQSALEAPNAEIVGIVESNDQQYEWACRTREIPRYPTLDDMIAD